MISVLAWLAIAWLSFSVAVTVVKLANGSPEKPTPPEHLPRVRLLAAAMQGLCLVAIAQLM